jgi:membrane peptidoglycan carboxypeptidase
MTDMLKDVIKRGTGKNARVKGIELAGKTGTTNDNVDAWFCGYSPTIETIVWFGRDNNRRIGRKATGGSLAAPAFAYYYRKLLELYPKIPRTFKKSEGVFEGMADGKPELYTAISPLPKAAATIEEEQKNRYDRMREDENYVIQEEDVDPIEPPLSSDQSEAERRREPLLPDDEPASAKEEGDDFLEMFGETKKPSAAKDKSTDSFFDENLSEETATDREFFDEETPRKPRVDATVHDDGTIVLYPKPREEASGKIQVEDRFESREEGSRKAETEVTERVPEENEGNIIQTESDDPLHPKVKPPLPVIDEESGTLF